MNVKKDKIRFSLKPVAFISIGFLILILVGALILYLPISRNENVEITFLDSLFTSTSASCVTGLLSINNSSIIENYSVFGRIIICILVQIGGLGVATFAMVFILIISSKLSLEQQSLIKESWNLSTFKGLKKIFIYNIIITLVIEGIGALLIFIDLIVLHNNLFSSTLEIIANSIFLSISSFNNAGFDLFGGSSLISFNSDPFLLITLSLLIILGGLGYLVIIDIVKNKFKIKKLSLHSKVVLFMSLFLIIAGTILIFASEKLSSLDSFNEGITLLDSYFLSVSSRTAGMTSFDLYNLNSSTLLIIFVLMFIGASPGGTGGGIKTTTFFVLLLQLRSNIDKKTPHAFRRNIDSATIKKAFSLITLGIFIFVIGIAFIFFFEEDISILNERSFSIKDYLIDAMSAYATVGLSTGYVPYYKEGSKLILILLMYIGRLGPLTISTSLWEKKTGKNWAYISEDLPIG